MLSAFLATKTCFTKNRMREMLLSTSEIFSVKTPLTNMVEYKEQTAQIQLELELIKVLLSVITFQKVSGMVP